MPILVTGGAGYIGSHTCVELLEAGHEVVVVDNLINSSQESINRIEKISGKPVRFHRVDLLDKPALQQVFEKNSFEAVIHFAGLKAVGESVEIPRQYYHNNLTGTLVLCEVMEQFGVGNIVFSSSATVYGKPESVPITEEFPIQPTNPYGATKWMIERMLTDIQAANPDWRVVILRYFNPVGAHRSGLIGESPNGIPNNLMPYIQQVAVRNLPQLEIFGNDYETPDGTGVRDYIHVVDLSRAHLAAIETLEKRNGVLVYNVGTGRGFSVLEMVDAFEKASGVDIPYQIVERRPGDIAESYADPSKAEQEMNWKATLGLDRMCADAWNWQSKNPKGFEE